MVDGGIASGGVKSVHVDGGGTGVVIDTGRECRAINHGGSGGGGDDGWDNSRATGGGVVAIDESRRRCASNCGGSGGHVVAMERWEEGWERRCLGVVGDCAGDTLLVIFRRGREVWK